MKTVSQVDPALYLPRYIYCDEIDLCADTVLATLYAAKKYIVPHLARACVNFLETSLSAKNACVLLSQSCLFEEPDLTQRCWEVIDAQAELALRSEGFCDIDTQTLESILRRETLNAKEMVVFEAALNWAEAECQRQDLTPTIENKRLVLGKAIYLIRIPTMGLEDFANGAAQSGVLTLNETNDISCGTPPPTSLNCCSAPNLVKAWRRSAATASSPAPTGATSGGTEAAATASSSPWTDVSSSPASACTAPAAVRPSTAPRSS